MYTDRRSAISPLPPALERPPESKERRRDRRRDWNRLAVAWIYCSRGKETKALATLIMSAQLSRCPGGSYMPISTFFFLPPPPSPATSSSTPVGGSPQPRRPPADHPRR
jgi:hypothetical protein